VLRLEPNSQRLLTPDQLSLLDACVHQVALSLEVDRRYEKTATKQFKLKTDLARIALLTSISNDLKKPLQKIGTVSCLLKKNEDEAISNAGGELYYQTNKIGHLNNNILLILQLESQSMKLEKKATSLLSLIQSVIRLSLTIIKTRSIKSDIPRDLPTVMLNPKLIQAVLINLIDNADKFSPLKAPIIVSVHLDKKNIVVSVEDHGKGIVPDEKDQLFEKFYQGRELSQDKTFTSVPGLGLGLAVCQKIIIAHGGKIWVENLAVKGAAFRFDLPIGD
jgi:two-component system sensor histidine kinase KdpD